MGRVANQQLKLQSLLKKSGSLKSESYPQPKELDGIRVTLGPPPVWKLEALHLVGDALILVSIWLIAALKVTRGGTRGR